MISLSQLASSMTRRTKLLGLLTAAGLTLVAPNILFGSTKGSSETKLVAFYVPWDTEGQSDLIEHINAVDVLAPFLITLKTPDGTPSITDDPRITPLSFSPSAPMVMPVIANTHDAIWDSAIVDAIFTTPQSMANLTSALVKLAEANHYAGYVFDLENLSSASTSALPKFVGEVQAAFGPAHLQTWLTVPVTSADWPTRAIQEAGATVVLMAYDQCWANSTPGPIAGEDWFGPALAQRMKDLDASKAVVALGNYAYDWPAGKPAKVLSVNQAIQIASENGAQILREAPHWNPTFTYTGPDAGAHTVWMLDGGTFARQKATALRFRPKAIGLWRMGLEDSAVWKNTNTFPHAKLLSAQIPPPVCTMLP